MSISHKRRRWIDIDFDQEPSKKITKSKITSKDYKNMVICESDIQQSFIHELGLCGRKYKNVPIQEFIYAVPNGGYRDKNTARKLKAEGVKKGIPDLHCFIAVDPYHSLYIEMKTEVGDLSPDQKKMIPLIRAEGHKVVVCRSAEHAKAELFKYLGWGTP